MSHSATTQLLLRDDEPLMSTVDWDPTAKQLGLQLDRGTVLVSGPIVGQDLALSPGQRLSVSLPRAETVISGPQEERYPESRAPSCSF